MELGDASRVRVFERASIPSRSVDRVDRAAKATNAVAIAHRKARQAAQRQVELDDRLRKSSPAIARVKSSGSAAGRRASRRYATDPAETTASRANLLPLVEHQPGRTAGARQDALDFAAAVQLGAGAACRVGQRVGKCSQAPRRRPIRHDAHRSSPSRDGTGNVPVPGAEGGRWAPITASVASVERSGSESKNSSSSEEPSRAAGRAAQRQIATQRERSACREPQRLEVGGRRRRSSGAARRASARARARSVRAAPRSAIEFASRAEKRRSPPRSVERRTEQQRTPSGSGVNDDGSARQEPYAVASRAPT